MNGIRKNRVLSILPLKKDNDKYSLKSGIKMIKSSELKGKKFTTKKHKYLIDISSNSVELLLKKAKMQNLCINKELEYTDKSLFFFENKLGVSPGESSYIRKHSYQLSTFMDLMLGLPGLSKSDEEFINDIRYYFDLLPSRKQVPPLKKPPFLRKYHPLRMLMDRGIEVERKEEMMRKNIELECQEEDQNETHEKIFYIGDKVDKQGSSNLKLAWYRDEE